MKPSGTHKRARHAVSVYDRMWWPALELERALRSGAHRRELAAYFGEEEYGRLRTLARAAARGRRHPSYPKVYLLPGIMGSQLGRRRESGQPPDLLWLDPSDIIRGRLTALRSGHKAGIEPLGAIVYSYLPLKLRLQAAGFEVVLYDYDWRADLRVIGHALAARLRADDAERIALVGHSMGGLLARAALADCAGEPTGARIKRVIGLGTPHGGSIAAVQALRATNPLVRRLGALDRRHTAEELSRKVFASFASIYQLLPAFGVALDLFDLRSWPQRGPRPHAVRLAATRGYGVRLALADRRFASIIGIGQRTVTGLERRGGQFHYEITAGGDGTVASSRASLPGASSFYLRCEHSELPRSELVAAALADLLRTGRTKRLSQRAVVRRGRAAHVSDADLRRNLPLNIDWQRLSTDDRRHFFALLSAPPSIYWPARR
jgi:pimeloyl-ACP methyl ester carboxylesterase